MPEGRVEAVARHVVVHGRVQSVGFRMAAASRARARGVSGWVRNLPDGTVEAVFQGEPDAVDSLLRWCSDGPRGSSVSHVDVDEVPPDALAAFEIR